MKIDPHMPTILAAALECSERGWHVFPAPVGKKCSHKSAEFSGGRAWGATTDAAEIERDWQQWPSANLGIVTGPKSGFFVIDADTEDGHGVDGVGTLAEWIEEHGPLPDTIEAITPSGGWHVFFRCPDDLKVQNSEGRVAPGIDVRGDGGMVLGTPSVKPNVGSYRWKNPPGFFDLGECPEWLLEKVLAAQKPKLSKRAAVRIDTGGDTWGDAALRDELAGLLSAPEGCRNGALNQAAFKLGQIVGGGHLSESLVVDRLAAAAQGIGLEAGEIGPTIQSGLTAGMAEPRKPVERDPGQRSKSSSAASKTGLTYRHEDLDLIRDDKERPIWNMANAITLLTEHSDWQDILGFNSFTMRRVLLSAVPGQGCSGYPRPLEDDDYAAAQAWFNHNGFPKASMEIVQAAVRKVCRHQSFDPLRDYLSGLEWDGVARLGSWLTSYCGAEATAYTSEVGMRWCVSAVARGFEPGCKADHMLVLEGAQGRRKSSALAALAGEDWFSDALPQMGTKDAQSYLRGRWIIEVGELEAMRKEVDAIKAFLTRQVETFRPAYGREEVSEPRRCVFAGTTNKDDWQRDETGGRRFWPVKVGAIDVPAIERDRDQLWAEAVALFQKGERWWLEGDLVEQAQAEAADRRPEDPWRADIARAVEGRSEITAKEVLGEMGVLPSDMTPQLSKRVTQELVALGWSRAGRVTSGQAKGAARYVPGEAQ